MIDKIQIENIKNHLKDYLEETGRVGKPFFKCVNPSHDDTNPSMSYNYKANNIKCFSCNCSYDLISLYALDHNLDSKADFKQILEELATKYNENIKITSSEAKQDYSKVVVKEDYTKYINKCKKNISKTNYLQTRGISEDIINKYNIGYDEETKRVIFPLSDKNYIARSTEVSNPIKHYKPKGSTNELFNGAYLKDSNFKSVIWITEAIIDALSLEEVNEDIKAISLNSINNAKQLVSEAKANNYKGVFILALDTDIQGLRASQELQEDLDLIGIKAFIFNSSQDKYNVSLDDGNEVKNKDINDYLLSDKEKLKSNANYYNDTIIQGLEQQAIKTYEQENALNYLDTFKLNIQNQEKNIALSTGISSLDKAIEGGFYKKQLVILGAISSLGKTTLALQIADNIARQGEEVLIFSLEMAKDELIAKSLSRLSFLKAKDINYTALSFTTRDIMTGKGYNTLIPNNEQRIDIFNKALEDYKTIANNIYISELSEDNNITIKTIEENIKRHIAITNNKPFVIIDYLQIIQATDKYLNDKQKIDKVLTDLKRLARDNDITILSISSLNRGAYTQEISLDSFKDSGNIEYTADLLLGLQAETNENINNQENAKKVKEQINKVQQQDERSLTLKVLKNRNGRITDIKGIKFYAKYNYMYFNEDTNY